MNERKVLEIKNSIISGRGTFATVPIPRGTYITTLTGNPFPKKDIDAICEALNIHNDDPLQIDEKTMLALDPPSKTINHSCQPNAGLRHQCDLYAIQDIYPGEEITYDYSTTVGTDDPAWRMHCHCETVICRKEIGYILSLPAITLSKYREYDVLPDFIKRELGNPPK